MDADYEKNLTTPSPDGPQFRPAKGYLMVLGFFILFAGLLFCGIGWFYAFKLPEMMSQVPSPGGGEELFGGNMRSIMISVGMSIAAVGLGAMILGIGSMALRRWARDLLYATGWLLIGFAGLMTIGMVFSIPSFLSLRETMIGSMGGSAGGGAAGSAGSIAMMVGVVIGFLFYVLIAAVPGVLLVLVYRSKNVELTTRYYDQKPSWTENCHVTVLVLWLFFVLGIITIGTMFFGYSKLLADFGMFPSAAFGNSIFGAAVVILAVLAFGVSRSAPWAWWGTLVYLIACGTAGFYFYQTADMESIYRQFMVLPGEEGSAENEALLAYGRANIRAGYFSGILTLILLIGYLVMIRKHFTRTGEVSEPESS